MCKDPCEKPLKLEAGKRYVLRNGKETGPLEARDSAIYPWRARLQGGGMTSETWTGDGRYIRGHSDVDIVAECIEPELEPFDLARAKAGEPIQRPGGETLYFVAHDPKAVEHERVIVRDSQGQILTRREDGSFRERAAHYRIVMAPKPVVKHKITLTLKRDADGNLYTTRNPASTPYHSTLASVEVEFTEGQFAEGK